MKTNYTIPTANGVLKLAFVLATTLVTGTLVQAQNNVGIGTTTPNQKAILELKATDKGFLAPRMNTFFMNAIAPTAAESALLIYNTDSACYHFYNGTAWKNLCDKRLDTALLNKYIKNYLNSNLTTIINNAIIDSSKINYANITNAVINNAIINNAIINTVTIDSSKTNYADINNLVVDSSKTNYADINNLVVDSSKTNYADINIAVIDSLQANYINANTGNFNTLNVGGQNIMNTISDSIASQAWLLKGNNAALTTNKLGTLNARNLNIYAGGVQRMLIAQGTGNVGINQLVPAEKLDVAGNVKFSGALMPNGLSGTAGELLTSSGAGTPTWTSPTSINTNTIPGMATTTAVPLLVMNGLGDIAYKNATSQGVILVDPSSGCWKLTVSATGGLVTQSIVCP